MRDKENSDLIEVVQRLGVKWENCGYAVGEQLLPLDFRINDCEVMQGDDDYILGLAALEVL
jgi:hypothetical protein